MVEKTEKKLDTRTVPEIWRSLTPAQQSELRALIISETLCTRQSINNWANGATPIYRDIRVKIARCMMKAPLELNVRHFSLFPGR